jgi:DNA-binding MarR family transcriptional regulator
MKPHESLGFEVGLMSRAFERELRAALHQFRVLPGQLPVLLALYDRDGRTQAELARTVGIEQPTMAATLGRMERAGLVERSPDEEDARRARVGLTKRARELQRPLIDAARAVNRRAVRGLSADDRSVLYRVVERVSANLGARN